MAEDEAPNVRWGLRHVLAGHTRELAEERLRRACDRFLTGGGYVPLDGWPQVSEVQGILQIEVWACRPAKQESTI